MNKKRKLDQYNSSDLTNFIKEKSNDSSIDQRNYNNIEYIDPTLNLMESLTKPFLDKYQKKFSIEKEDIVQTFYQDY